MSAGKQRRRRFEDEGSGPQTGAHRYDYVLREERGLLLETTFSTRKATIKPSSSSWRVVATNPGSDSMGESLDNWISILAGMELLILAY